MKNALTIGPKAAIFTDPQDGLTKYMLENVPIVSFDSRRVILQTGGKKTLRMRRRLNKAAKVFDLGYNIWQKDEDWFVRLPSGRNVLLSEPLEIPRTNYAA